MIELNGIAHIQLTVRDVRRSRSFYHKLLHECFGMTIQYDEPDTFYCIGGRTGVLIRPATPEHRDTPFDQWRIGLHHLCFRLRSREDIDALHVAMMEIGEKIIRAGTGAVGAGLLLHPVRGSRRHPNRSQFCARPRESGCDQRQPPDAP